MQHSDEVIWQIINHQFCSFKAKLARDRTFCQNPYNVTGLCLRSACPLANSRYATIREEDGKCYLYIKTVERMHTPNRLWEKITLPANYAKALELVSKELEDFPKYLVHRNKQRLTKIHQMLIRMRKLKLKTGGPKIVAINTNVEKVEAIRERKALKAAQLDRAIEKELLDRLAQVASDKEIYNYPESQYLKALGKAQTEDEEEEDEEELEDEELGDEAMKAAILKKLNESKKKGGYAEMEEEEEEEEDPDAYNVEYVEDFEESDDEDDMEDTSLSSSSSFSSEIGKKRSIEDTTMSSKKKKGARVEIEYEMDDEEGEAHQPIKVSQSSSVKSSARSKTSLRKK